MVFPAGRTLTLHNPRLGDTSDSRGAPAADAGIDPDARAALHEEASRVLVADATAIFAHAEHTLMLIKPYVAGYAGMMPNWNYPGWTNLLTLDIQRS